LIVPRFRCSDRCWTDGTHEAWSSGFTSDGDGELEVTQRNLGLRALDRRTFLRGAAAFGAGAWLGGRAMLSTPATARTISAIMARAGTLEVTALLDASGPFFESWTHAFPNGTDEDFARARTVDPEAFNDDGLWHLDFHCFAIRRPDGHITLVDAGVGPADSPASAWAPVPGVLPDALTTAGIGVHDVDFVVLSHLHEDHIGWVVRDGRPLFAEATYLVQQAELHQLEQGPDRTIWNYAIAPLLDSGQLDAISGHTRLRGGARGSGDTVTAIPTPGHTIGHQSVLVNSGGRQIFITGDVLVHAVQLVNPDVVYRFEADQARAARTRRTVLRHARANGALLAVAHLNQPFVTP
jgi:glyoxylase-like metal-dependent hydrolase (beta-lactamase superfamily II)